MDIIRTKDKVLQFTDIRPGTIFICGGVVYIKTDKNRAVDLESGHEATEDVSKWNKCTIYPRASLKLN